MNKEIKQLRRWQKKWTSEISATVILSFCYIRLSNQSVLLTKLNHLLLPYERYLIWVILVFGVLLRLVNIGDVAYMHDELSALSRIQFDSLGALFEKGIKPDAHPPLIQLFLFFWTNIFGYAEWIVKLPFILCGIASIWLIYDIGKNWFSEKAGLLSAAVIAATQYTVFYSQIIRPYSSGMFFCILVAWCFTHGFYKPAEAKRKRNLFRAGFSVSLALAGYNHHFSLIEAGLFASLSWVILPKHELKYYFLFCLFGALLYLPNIPLALTQLSYGGVGEWLGPPKPDFLLQYLRYIVHYSTIPFVIIGIAFIYSVSGNTEWKGKTSILIIISLLLFFLPFLLAYYYSLEINPILQFSTLIFGFPFLLLGIFSGIADSKNNTAPVMLLVLFLLAAQTVTLIGHRKYYDIIAHQPFERFVRLTDEFYQKIPKEKTVVVFNTENWFIDFYQKRSGKSFPYKTWYDKEYSDASFTKWMMSQDAEYLIGANLNENWVPLIKFKYPYVIKSEMGFTYEYYIFSKTPVREADQQVHFSTMYKPGAENKEWEVDTTHERLIENELLFEFDSTLEYSLSNSQPLKKRCRDRHTFVVLSAEVKLLTSGADAFLVQSLEKTGITKPIDWRASSFTDQIDRSDTLNWQPVALMNRLNNIFKTDDDLRNMDLKVYFWNKDRVHILLRNLKIELRDGNRKVYGLYEDF